MLRTVPPLAPTPGEREEREEFRAVFAELFPRLRGFFLSCGFQAADADDLSQTAMWTVYKSRGQFRGDGSFEAWAYSIARNVARDEWRRRGRTGEEEPVDEAIVDDVPSAETQSTDRQELKRTLGALAKLPAGMRACLLLHVQKGLSYREIGQRLSLAIPTVKVQIWNARRRLRSLLEDEVPP
ncbi:MAG TPA: sigma-70 family RNA polymerase sigma factor [Thermoanaerobaculia bacterium]|nr:sigma-70 family RNA polymerase sigma factor [Thermoanaerobaculia bacterium]